MLSLTFALLRSYPALNFWQIMVAVMSLDTISAIVQMALSQKDTLASRWWVVLNAISQLFVHASIGIVLGKTFPLSSAQQDPCRPCVRVVWWSTFTSCKKVPWMFWLYYTVRALLVIRSCAIGLHHMHYYDFGERIARGEKPSQKVSQGSHLLRLFTFSDPTEDITIVYPDGTREIKTWSLEGFSRMPATTLTDWVLWMVPAVVASSSLERMLILFKLSNTGKIEDWGQTTTFMAVICGLVARAIYLFYAKLERRSCLERTKLAAELSEPSETQKTNLSAGDFASLASKRKSFREIQRVLQPIDCVRWRDPREVWYQHVDSEEAKEEFLKAAAFNDTNGLIMWAKHLSDLSTVVDNMNRTALHLALEKNNIEAIETITGLMDRGPEPQPGQSSATVSRNMQKLLDAPDKTQRTPWEMIMPTQYSDMKGETLEAFLRFKYPVKPPGKSTPSSEIINMIFTLPYALEVMEVWIGATEASQSLRQLEECIIQAVQTGDRPHHLKTEKSIENVYEFWGRQHERIGRTVFAGRLFKAFAYSAGLYSWPMPEHIPSLLTQFIRQKQVWAMESYTDIVRIVATCGDSVDDLKFLIENHPQHPQIDEQTLVGAFINDKVDVQVIEMILKEWPDQMSITPKVLEALLARTPPRPYILLHLLKERPYQIQVTESILMFAAQCSGVGTQMWKALLKSHRPQIKMTQHIFETMVNEMLQLTDAPDFDDDNDIFKELLNRWPSETKITTAVLLSIVQQNGHIVFEPLYELRRNELGTAIDSEALVSLGQRSTKNDRRRVVNFFFERYPEECKASITDQVLRRINPHRPPHRLWSIEAERTMAYFESFRQGSLDDRFDH